MIIPNYQREEVNRALFSMDETERSFNLMLDLDASFSKIDSLPYNRAVSKDFGSDFLGTKVSGGDFRECRFNRTPFTGANAQNSRFVNCVFRDCEMSSCNMQYCDFSGSIFLTENQSNEINGTNFSYSDFSHSKIQGLHFKGVSFSKALMSSTKLSGVSMIGSTIEASNMSDAIISNCDFSKSSIRYSQLRNATIKNSCFPLLDIPFNFGLVELLKKDDGNTITAKSRNGVLFSSAEVLGVLTKLLPYYSETEQYFALCNLLVTSQKKAEATTAFQKAFENAVNSSDYYGLQNLCRLAVISRLFNKTQLREFYDYIFRVLRPKSENHSELMRYLSSKNEVREQLVENPENNPVALFSLSTSIADNDYNSVSSLMGMMEHEITAIDASATISFEITHHSPFDIILAIVASVPTIIPICQLLYYSITTIKNSVDLANIASGSRTPPQAYSNGIKVRRTKKSRCLSFGKFEIKLTSEHEKHYGRIKDVSYTITGIDSSIANGYAFASNADLDKQ